MTGPLLMLLILVITQARHFSLTKPGRCLHFEGINNGRSQFSR